MRQVILNGFGRIGRLWTRLYHNDQNKNFNLYTINDLQSAQTCAHLFQYDSTYRASSQSLDLKTFTQEKSLSKVMPQGKEVLVVDATGVFCEKNKAQLHLDSGASKVLISAPAKSEGFTTICYGINHKDLMSQDRLVSAASCTTGALAPIVKVFSSNFAVKNLFFTTVHAATNDQRIQDTGHADLRRARSVFGNLIPTATGGSKAIKEIFPDISFPIHGMAIRSPHAAVSLLDITIDLGEEVSKEEIEKLFHDAANGSLKGILRLESQLLVSSDFIGESCSAVIDLQTLHVSGQYVKFIVWYDNEYGYADKLYSLTKYLVEL